MASKYLEWKYRDVKPDEPVSYTKKELRKNWWAYHKWHVVIGAFVTVAALDIARSVFSIGEITPDYQIAYVGKNALPQDTVNALSERIAELGSDLNHDGRTLVKINQYPSVADSDDLSTDVDAAQYAYASEIALMADLESCDSYFFLLEDPVNFQKDYMSLAYTDGSTPSEYMTDYEACYYAVSDLPVLTGANLGTYTETAAGQEITGDSDALIQNLYLARRCFYQDKTVRYKDGCDELFDKLTKGVLYE